MAVDASRIAGMRRRGLGSPPKDGAPGLEGVAEAGSGAGEDQIRDMGGAAGDAGLPSDAGSVEAHGQEMAGEGRGGAPAQIKRRAPASREEPRVPFTTRVTVSTKERLEEACYHLRTKHQAFIDEAIRAHLEKKGF